MNHIIIMLAAALVATGATAQESALTRTHENYMSTICNRMNDAARLAVAGAERQVPQSLTYGTIYRIGERLVFDNFPDADDDLKATIKADWREYATVLVDRAYSPNEHSWFSPSSTDLCVWNLNRCVEHTGTTFSKVFPGGDQLHREVREGVADFQRTCKPPEYNDTDNDCKEQFDDPFPGESVDPLLRLSLSCQRKIGSYPK